MLEIVGEIVWGQDGLVCRRQELYGGKVEFMYYLGDMERFKNQ